MRSISRRVVYLPLAVVFMFLGTCFIWVSFSSFVPQVNQNLVSLMPVKQNFAPKEFYINSVSDFRSNKASIGNLIELGEAKNIASSISANLEGGTMPAIKNFFSQSLPVNKKLLPINIHINTLKITEEKVGILPIAGSVDFEAVFYIQKEYDVETYFLSYHGKAKYQRSSNYRTVIDHVLQQTFSNALVYFNTYINQEISTNVLLAKAVKLNFSDYSKQDADTVYYSKARPLTWDDFKGNLSSSKYAAYIYPDFAYNEDVSVKNRVIQVNFVVRVFLAKSASWVNNLSKNSYILNHEQRHFDIQKIFGEKFKNDLKAEKLTPDNYEGIVNVQYLETRREIHRMQEKYDDETNHGLNASQQVYWDKFIDEQLLKYKIN